MQEASQQLSIVTFGMHAHQGLQGIVMSFIRLFVHLLQQDVDTHTPESKDFFQEEILTHG